MKQRLLLIAMLTMSTFCSWAGSIFVSVNGDDANDGTITHPVKPYTKRYGLLVNGGVWLATVMQMQQQTLLVELTSRLKQADMI